VNTATSTEPDDSAKPKSWLTGLTPEMVAKQQAFYNVRVKHPAMDALLEDLMPLLMPHSESNIIVVTGATGAGKSTLTRVLLKSLVQEFAALMDSEAGTIPLVAVEAYADGDVNPGFKNIYKDIIAQLLEPAAEKKTPVQFADGKLVVQPFANGTIPGLRRVVEQGLKRRRTRVGVIDEAAHLGEFDESAKAMHTLKSLSNTTGIKWVLVGAFNMFDMLRDGGEVARRASVLCLERYRHDRKKDREAFEAVVRKLQSKWPCEDVPNFAAISDALLEMSLGCIGLLKSFMLDASAMQLRNGGVWSPAFLQKAVKSNGLRDVIRREIEVGEKKVRDALYGSSPWDDETLSKLAHRMETAHA